MFAAPAERADDERTIIIADFGRQSRAQKKLAISFIIVVSRVKHAEHQQLQNNGKP